MKLYELSAEYERFMQAVMDGEIPEECIDDTLEGLEGEIELKFDSIACIIKEYDALISAITAEKSRLEARKKTARSQAKRLEEYLIRHKDLLKLGKLETARNRISFRQSTAVAITDEGAFLDWARENRDDLLRYKAPEADLTAIKNAISSGDVVVGAEIRTNHSVQIK